MATQKISLIRKRRASKRVNKIVLITEKNNTNRGRCQEKVSKIKKWVTLKRCEGGRDRTPKMLQTLRKKILLPQKKVGKPGEFFFIRKRRDPLEKIGENISIAITFLKKISPFKC